MKKTLSVLLICIMLTSSFSSVTAFAEYDRLPFTDLYHSYTNGYLNIKSLVEKGIIEGKTDTIFAPDDPLTREQAAKILVLASDAPLVSKTGSFTDVASGSWYEVYVESALAAGLMNGESETTFGVGKYIIRQDAAVLAARMAEYMNIDIEKVKDVTIADMVNISDYAKDSVVSLVNMNIAPVKTDNKFLPANKIKRIDFCIFIDRVLISDKNYYDDYLADWMPQEINVENSSSEIVAFEDFENGLSVLDGYEVSYAGYGNAKNYIVNNIGKDSASSLSCSVEKNKNAMVNIYLRTVDPGVDYFINYDLKTVGLSDTSFVRVNYQWYNASGYLTGTYERNNDFYGTNDWTNQSAAITAPLPDSSPKFLRIALSIRDSEDGIVYLDNLKIYKMIHEPLTTYLKSPAYKGLITNPNGEGDIRLTTYIKGLGSIFNKEDYKVEVGISTLDGNETFEKEVLNSISEEMDITFSSAELSVGDYDLYAKMVNKSTGEIVGINHWVIRKRDENFTSKYRFDEHGRLLKDGKPHFPIGTYALGLTESDINDFKGTPIEFYMANSTSRFWINNHLFASMRENNLSAMISTDSFFKDAMRGEHQNPDITNIASERVILERVIDDLNITDEDAFIGYQINNEFPATNWAHRLAWHQQILSEKDFEHLTYGVGAGGKKAAIDYVRCHDVYASDPYPITGAASDEIWQVYKDAKGLVDGTVGRPVWTVVQISDLKVMGRDPYLSRERGPNETELRNMVWQAVCAGAQGVLYYAHFHLDHGGATRPKEETYPEVLRVSNELDKYKDVILSVEDAPDVKPVVSNSSRFAHLVRRHNDKTYIFMVNMSKETQNVTLTLESSSSAYGEYSKKDYDIANNGKVELSLEGLGVEVLVVDQAGRPSHDCELKNVHLYDENNSYFIVKDGEINNIYLPIGLNTLNYNVDIHPDARVIVNGCPNKTKGSMSLEGKDKITFTVISEDGQNYSQHWYNIIRK